jgi:hypothetical protein
MSNILDSQSIGEAFAFVGTRNPSPEEIGGLSADIFQSRYKELCATLDMDELGARLFAWVRVNAPIADGPMSIPDQVSWAEYGVLTLFERGVLKPTVETPESRRDLEKLRIAVGKSGLRPAPATVKPTATPAGPSEADLDAEAIAFWRANLTSEVRSRMRREPAFADRINRLTAENRI